jgi:lipopolysaccharide transport system permease protein
MRRIYTNINGLRSFQSYFAELIDSKYIIYEFIKRDLKIVYVQSITGPIFYILFPLLQCFVYLFLFGIFSSSETKLINFNIQNLLYFMATIPIWNLFVNSVIKGSSSYVINYKIINKIYFSRLIFFITPFLVALFHFILQFIIFLLIYFIFYKDINLFIILRIIIVPFVIIYCFILSFSLSLLIASISLRYRDLVYSLNYILQLGIFLTPVLYPLSKLSGLSLFIILLNPFSMVPEIFRWIFFNEQIIYPVVIFINLITGFSLFLVSLLIFRKNEKIVADLI